VRAAALLIDVLLGPDDLAEALRHDARAGLTATPKCLPPKYFYDELGSALFEKITDLPEYYPARREREILGREAGEIARLAAADTLVELGSGSSAKTRLLLDALAAGGTLERFVPFDVSEPTLRAAGEALTSEYPGLQVHGVVGDFERHLGELPEGGRRLVAFLGGTIGNLEPDARGRFLQSVAAGMEPGDALLLGTDLVKDWERLVAAYDDSTGVTAEFNRNVLHVLNGSLEGDFVPGRFEHVAIWDDDHEWIEMRLRSSETQVAHLAALDLTVTFEAGEEMRTEISAKFRREGVARELMAAGLDPQCWWTDARGDFALSLSFA